MQRATATWFVLTYELNGDFYSPILWLIGELIWPPASGEEEKGEKDGQNLNLRNKGGEQSKRYLYARFVFSFHCELCKGSI